MQGYRPPERAEGDLNIKELPIDTIPTSIDWRTYEAVTPIKD